MTSLRSLFAQPLFHLSLLTGAMLVALATTTIHPMDDHFHYQKFIETLATGRVDLSIAGFQGASFLAFPLYLITQSPLTNIHFQLLCAALLIPAMYLAVRALFRDDVLALFGAYAMAMMPFFSFFSFRGFTFASYTLFVLLTLWLYGRGSRWAWLPYGISIITKPFSLALIPLFLLWKPKGKQHSTFQYGWAHLGLAFIIPALYVVAQYAQIGFINASSSGSFDHTNVFAWSRFPLNAAHGIQMLFSVHNFYFLDPALTRPSNMVHSSPLLMVFGVFSLLYAREFWKDRRLAWCLGASFLAAYTLTALLDHMDNLYMQTSVLLLVIASLPLVKRFPLWIPIILATFHFQWLYAYLEFSEVFQLRIFFFVVPLVVDLLLLAWCVVERQKVWEMVKESGFMFPG